MSRMKAAASIAAVMGLALSVSSAGFAQVATSLEQAELAGLSPEKRAEVETPMKQGGQTVGEILTTILLNSIKVKHSASRIVALDFGRGIAVVETPAGKTETVNFDTTTLAIK